MQELPLAPREDPNPHRALGSVFDENIDSAGLVNVVVGPYDEHLPLANRTVGEIRARFHQRFDIDPQTQAMVDGHEVGDDTIVRTGQALMFIHKAGEKGTAMPPDRRPAPPSPRGEGWGEGEPPSAQLTRLPG